LPPRQRIAGECLKLRQLLYVRGKVDILDHHKLAFVTVCGEVFEEKVFERCVT
jgi:hypothetical protein